jgi:hypothetical protein
MNPTKALDSPSANEISPRELYRRLRHHEEQLSDAAFKSLQTEFANQRFFSYPLFDPPGELSDESRESLSDPGVKYNFLLLLLRNCRTNEDRLLIIATWLHLQRICQPEDLLGKDFSRYRRNALRGSRGRLSVTDLRYAFIVNIWEPYFEQLLLVQCKGRDLKHVGFEERAIQSAFWKHSPVAAACEYLSLRLESTLMRWKTPILEYSAGSRKRKRIPSLRTPDRAPSFINFFIPFLMQANRSRALMSHGSSLNSLQQSGDNHKQEWASS